MIVTCNAEHWKYMESLKPPEAPCGRTYDDAERSTMCPHKSLVKINQEERIALMDDTQRAAFNKIMGYKE